MSLETTLRALHTPMIPTKVLSTALSTLLVTLRLASIPTAVTMIVIRVMTIPISTTLQTIPIAVTPIKMQRMTKAMQERNLKPTIHKTRATATAGKMRTATTCIKMTLIKALM
ncbi:hypothetical protein B0J13DRAFT_568358 [Dactylonectria estremocensis]|uniref:Uncharacterized protein n=1 Tax=Dactylonectria estremocensis TaxID=1079267 RepID=A0A9P9DGG1_9HYPO|nr:hypothetical protein B0J13DRAFT_568358 [Dactylonectria estremocensis]